ncbi:2-oxoglutarate dehydrogenase complex dihydrolipoyllysine-residue succinyltransferase [Ichthyobacterium seriolicida]|uniref:Dihydrolipoyllysine-residue succinyltransferase component of 2-oxoglutarate dehydrogenase complex n=1 Tax=Ichthyobacterium seriolicida TaxID=242600 RepID=A0A1J1DWN4_9FLAO|nr:2-oxoglutarate dehydrogenase complex dihydrolipoyllysine-residue succinyltransferase [Ichthyobacterium seriolicida]BAV94281.1 dihydrolipoamide succinyltransferase component of 2-oxoglutarate dehydrogenase complex [Ichthyobacterium seriolicida]
MVEIKIPSPGESISEVEIASWLVQNGDYVEKEQTIAEIDSDKATLELPAECSGVIHIKVEEGNTVKVGEVVCHIDTTASKPDKAESVKNTKPTVETPVMECNSPKKESYATGTPSPSAKKMMEEVGVSKVDGSGRDGRIIKEDVVKAVAAMGSNPIGNRGASRKKMSLLRKKISQRLVSVKNETAMLSTFNEVDMSAVMSLREKYKDRFNEKHGVKLGFMSFFTKAVVRSLGLYPDVGSMIDGDEQITYAYSDISIAVSTPKGLMVPVLRNAETMSFKAIELEIKKLSIKAREGKLSLDDMIGGNFSITNGGVFGSMLSTPIINPPQSAILGMHNIVDRPVVVNGNIEIRPIMYVALSYDHRIIDGSQSVSFLVELKKAIENPTELLMDGREELSLEL